MVPVQCIQGLLQVRAGRLALDMLGADDSGQRSCSRTVCAHARRPSRWCAT